MMYDTDDPVDNPYDLNQGRSGNGREWDSEGLSFVREEDEEEDV